MPSEHARAVALAEAQAESLRALFAAMGSAERPGGTIWRAYAIARQALGSRWTSTWLREVLSRLEGEVTDAASTLLSRAATLGARGAVAQLALYGLEAPAGITPPDVREARLAVASELTSRNQAILAGWALQPDPALIIGDGGRVGALSPAPIVTTVARLLTQTEQAAFRGVVRATPGARSYQRQAVATLGGRTTRCCLAVHGQVRGLDEPFTLVATPRFADQMLNPPFHNWCRTVVALVPPGGGDDALTRRMQNAADAEVVARDQGTTNQRSRSPSAVQE